MDDEARPRRWWYERGYEAGLQTGRKETYARIAELEDDVEALTKENASFFQAAADATREVDRLREALEAELTHCGIRDDVAQCATTAGAYASMIKSDVVVSEGLGKALRRLDVAGIAFYARVRAALDGS